MIWRYFPRKSTGQWGLLIVFLRPSRYCEPDLLGQEVFSWGNRKSYFRRPGSESLLLEDIMIEGLLLIEDQEVLSCTTRKSYPKEPEFLFFVGQDFFSWNTKISFWFLMEDLVTSSYNICGNLLIKDFSSLNVEDTWWSHRGHLVVFPQKTSHWRHLVVFSLLVISQKTLWSSLEDLMSLAIKNLIGLPIENLKKPGRLLIEDTC